MIDERKEFQCYTTFPVYETEKTKDTAFLNRISLQMLKKGAGFLRVLAIIARGYLYKDEIPDIEYARRALCAWCSIPAEKEADWQFDTNFAELHTEFPELVDEQGNGWLVRHVNNIAAFAESSPEQVTDHVRKNVKQIMKTFAEDWKKKVIQFQIPLFTESTKNDWLTLFDDVLADAQELGPLRSFRADVSEEDAAYIQSILPKGMLLSEAIEVIAYYKINKLGGTDWALYPSIHFEAYFGNTNFTHKYQAVFFEKCGHKTKEHCGVTRYLIYDNIANRVQITEIVI